MSPEEWPGISGQIQSRMLNVNDLEMHILEAYPAKDSDPANVRNLTGYPLIVLLHGFPELAYSWRRVMGPLANAHTGYHVVAPDLRGYGRTRSLQTAKDRQIQYSDPLAPFHILGHAADVHALVQALGYTSAAMIVGHDFGSRAAGFSVLAYPNVFRSVVFMSAPFVNDAATVSVIAKSSTVDDHEKENDSSAAHPLVAALASLDPPRKHYVAYCSTPAANADMLSAPNGLRAFIRGYFHVKSADWPENNPYLLPSATASSPPSLEALAKDFALLPGYYVMPLAATMPDVVSSLAPHVDEASWFPDNELDVYVSQYSRTGFQGGLNNYRNGIMPCPPEWAEQYSALAGRTVNVPAAFISGQKDWGVYQSPGAEQKMRNLVCKLDDGRQGMEQEDFVLIKNAGHWAQQEAPDDVVKELVRFLGKVRAGEGV